MISERGHRLPDAPCALSLLLHKDSTMALVDILYSEVSPACVCVWPCRADLCTLSYVVWCDRILTSPSFRLEYSHCWRWSGVITYSYENFPPSALSVIFSPFREQWRKFRVLTPRGQNHSSRVKVCGKKKNLNVVKREWMLEVWCQCWYKLLFSILVSLLTFTHTKI